MKNAAIEIEDLTKRFGKKTVLNRINLRIEKGEIFGYLGPNGAGKTTTIRLILGLLKPTSGSITLFNKRGDETKRHIGFMLHSPGLYPTLTCLENLELYAKIYGCEDTGRIRELLEEMELWEKRDERVITFSRGMKQKVALARALTHDPELLILDEPTTGLDPETQVWFRERIKQQGAEGKTILFATHDLDEVERTCSHIGIIYQGNILVTGSISELKNRSKSGSVEGIYLKAVKEARGKDDPTE